MRVRILLLFYAHLPYLGINDGGGERENWKKLEIRLENAGEHLPLCRKSRGTREKDSYWTILSFSNTWSLRWYSLAYRPGEVPVRWPRCG